MALPLPGTRSGAWLVADSTISAGAGAEPVRDGRAEPLYRSALWTIPAQTALSAQAPPPIGVTHRRTGASLECREPGRV